MSQDVLPSSPILEATSYRHKIYDAVHGFIRFNDLEKMLIDSEPFQRLHYIHQLGISFLVYPGATHTRFEHSLGTMELATRIFDPLTAKSRGVHEDLGYWRQVVRLAALCHDLGHLPFSHVAEKALLGRGGHERWTLAVIQSTGLAPLWEAFQKEYPEYTVLTDVIKAALGEKKCEELGLGLAFSPWHRAMTEMITGDFFGADRIDYLLRDAQCTGVSYGLFDYHQLIEMLCLLPEPHLGGLGVEENGIASCEALLLARHFMHQRVYQYPTSKSYAFHLARFMTTLYRAKGYLQTLEAYLSVTDNEVLTALRQALGDPSHEGHADAQALLKRHRRFFAVDLGKKVTAADLEALQKELGIPQGEIDWNLSVVDGEAGPSFSVLKRSGEVVDSGACSELFIPKAGKNWAFIAPEYAPALKKALESL